jgi:hypothetical protein
VAVNVTVRDIVNFPGGTAKTVTVDVIQVVPAGGSPEGDEIWVSSTTTTATASGGGSIESIFKNEMKRGFIRSSGLVPSAVFNIPASAKMVVAIDEALGSGVEIQLTSGSNLLAKDVAQDIEDALRGEAVIGGGGSKIGNLSYLNAQVRFENNRFSIESGTVSESFTGSSRSSVKVGPPATGTDIRATLGLDITTDSQTLAEREAAETDLTSPYSSGDTLTVRSTAGLAAGEAFVITDGTNSDTALVSGTVSASILRFTSVSGLGLGIANVYATGAMIRKLHEVDVSDPVSAITTMDQLYRFAIDSMVNQIDFSA